MRIAPWSAIAWAVVVLLVVAALLGCGTVADALEQVAPFPSVPHLSAFPTQHDGGVP